MTNDERLSFLRKLAEYKPTHRDDMGFLIRQLDEWLEEYKRRGRTIEELQDKIRELEALKETPR